MRTKGITLDANPVVAAPLDPGFKPMIKVLRASQGNSGGEVLAIAWEREAGGGGPLRSAVAGGMAG